MDPTFQKVSSVGLNRTDRPDRKGRKKAFLFLRFETEIVPFRIGFHDAKRVSPSLRDVRDVPRIASSSFHVEEELDLLDLSMLETDDVASERESEVGSCFRRSERRGKEEESTHGPDRSAFLDPSRRDLLILSKNEWNRFPSSRVHSKRSYRKKRNLRNRSMHPHPMDQEKVLPDPNMDLDGENPLREGLRERE